MVLADDPAELAQFGGLIEIRADLPYDVAGGLFDDQDDVGVAAVDDDVVGVEALVASVVPLFGPSTDMELMCIQSPMPSGCVWR